MLEKNKKPTTFSLYEIPAEEANIKVSGMSPWMFISGIAQFFNHLLRAMRSYNEAAIKQKINILNSMNEEEQNNYIINLQSQHTGKSNRWTSTSFSKAWDRASSSTKNEPQSNVRSEQVSFSAVKNYMEDKSPMFFCQHGGNCGRRFFKTIMDTKSIDWIIRQVNAMSFNQKSNLLRAIVKHSQSSFLFPFFASSDSKVLCKFLACPPHLGGKFISIENKVRALEEFLQQNKLGKQNKGNSEMLTIIEGEVARIRPCADNTRWEEKENFITGCVSDNPKSFYGHTMV